MKTHSIGVWRETNGICVDQVIRGCFNNGTYSLSNNAFLIHAVDVM